MPVMKKRRIVKRKATAKRSYAMLPRPRLNGELAHRHVVTCSTSTSNSAAQLFIQTTLGVTRFLANGPLGANQSENLSISWSLANMVVAVGGVPSISIPVPNVAELQQLYDTFQIEKVELIMFFGATEALVSGDAQLGIQYVMPLIGYAPDTDDAANTGITQLQQYSTYKMHQTTAPLKLSVVPCSAGATFDPSAGGPPAQLGFTRLQRQDINVAYAATPHYGYKFAVDGFKSTPAVSGNTFVSIQSRIHFLMKSTR